MKNFLFKIFIILPLIFSTSPAQEYQRFELSQITFYGNSNIASFELKNIIMSRESPNRFSKFLNSFSGFGEPPVYFDSSLIKLDIAAMQRLYSSRGFFKTKISYDYKFDPASESVSLNYRITENSPVYFNKLYVNGLINLPSQLKKTLDDYLYFDTTSTYSADKVENSRLKTVNALRDNGYMLTESAKPFVEVDTVKNTADVRYDFKMGRRYKISEVRVSKTGPGKDMVDDNLMKEITAIDTGTFYSNFELRRAQVRLYRTNLFSSALVTTITTDTVGSKVPLNISVDVNKMHELAPELITNNEDNTFNLGLGLGFTKKNFFGGARKFSIATSAAAQNIIQFLSNASIADTSFLGYADFRTGIEQPFLFGKPINTSLEFYYTLQKRRDEYNSSILGAKLSLDFELPQYTYFTSLTTYFNWENAKYIYQRSYIHNNLRTAFQRDFGDSVPIDSLVSYFMNNIIVDNNYSTTNTLLGVELGANHTDDILFPTKGYSLSFILEDGNSLPFLIDKLSGKEFKNTQYFKFLFSSSVFFPVFYEKTSSFGFKFKAGNIFTYRGSRANISLNQRFYGGGSNSIRAWGSRELVPRNPEIDISKPSEDFNSVLLKGITPGGFFILESSLELRQRLIGSLGYAVFVEAGNTWNGSKDFRFDLLAGAAGFGLRYYTDFIPIRVDFGFKAYDPFDRRSFFTRISEDGGFWNVFQFHLGIGEAF